MFDVDFSKRLNDQNGHGVLDHVLIELAAVIKRHFREVDLFCRFGRGRVYCVVG